MAAVGTMDELLNRDVITQLASLLEGAGSKRLRTVRAAASTVDGRNLRSRVDRVRDALLTDLPTEYAAVDQLVRDAYLQPEFTGWMLWPVTEVITTRAIAADQESTFDEGMAALALLTARLTAEFAIRSMIINRFDRAIAIATDWTTDTDEHVRRLASEGTRAHLPWAKGVPELIRRPDATGPIVRALAHDPSEYVRRSVANHVNDLSRKNPAVALAVVTDWAADPGPDTPAMMRHALRTMIKKADPQALSLLGFTGDTFAVDGPTLATDRLRVGDDLIFTVSITNSGSTASRAAIDFVVHFQKANGSLAPKVFKLAIKDLAPHETVMITKRHSLRPITTRVYHPGPHALELQVNGTRHGRVDFDLQF